MFILWRWIGQNCMFHLMDWKYSTRITIIFRGGAEMIPSVIKSDCVSIIQYYLSVPSVPIYSNTKHLNIYYICILAEKNKNRHNPAFPNTAFCQCQSLHVIPFHRVYSITGGLISNLLGVARLVGGLRGRSNRFYVTNNYYGGDYYTTGTWNNRRNGQPFNNQRNYGRWRQV